MSIASEITRLQNAKASLKTSINAKTDQQHQITTETLDDYADFVDSIQGASVDTTDIRTVINMTDANITSQTPFTDYPQSLYDGYINIIKDPSILINNLPQGTSTTGIITDGALIYGMKMTKESTQAGTPTPENPAEVNTVKTSVSITISDGTHTNTETINLGTNEICGIGNIKDEIIIDAGGKCYLNKKIGKINLNGTQTWYLAENNTNTSRFYTAVNDIINAGVAIDDTVYVMSNKLLGVKFGTVYSDKDAEYIVSNYNQQGSTTEKRIIVRIPNSIATTASNFRTWLSTNNITVYYVLITSQTINLNQTVDLTLYDGQNTVINSADMDMDITYIKDTYNPSPELPYIPLSYIEGSGTQYIDTGLKPKSTSVVDIKGTFIQKNGVLMGARDTSTTNKYYITTYFNNLMFNYDSTSSTSSVEFGNANVYYISNSLWKIDEQTIDNISITSFPNYSIYLFGLNTGGTAGVFAEGRIYYFKVYDGNTLVGNFIPVKRKSDNEICMYDLITEQYFTNQGTGTFVAGPEA